MMLKLHRVDGDELYWVITDEGKDGKISALGPWSYEEIRYALFEDPKVEEFRKTQEDSLLLTTDMAVRLANFKIERHSRVEGWVPGKLGIDKWVPVQLHPIFEEGTSNDE